MITVANFMKAVDCRITGGSEYQWQCYGPNARYLDCDETDFSVSIIFDTVDQTVYEATVFDYRNERAYRRFNPDFHKQYLTEAKERGITLSFAWDAVKFVDLETDEDWIEKATAIVNNTAYDERVSIPLELPDEELLVLLKMAHERDITFNQLMEDILLKHIEQIDKRSAPKITAKKKNKKKNRSVDRNELTT